MLVLGIIICFFLEPINMHSIISQFLLDLPLLGYNIHSVTIIDPNRPKVISTQNLSKYKPFYKHGIRTFVRVIPLVSELKLRDANLRKGNELFVIFNNFDKFSLRSSAEEDVLCEIIQTTHPNDYLVFETDHRDNKNNTFQKCINSSGNSNIFMFWFVMEKSIIERIELMDQISHHAQIFWYELDTGFSINMTSSNFQMQRFNLNGLELNAITSIWKPFVFNVNKEVNKDGSVMDVPNGMYIDIMNVLCSRLNITIRYHDTHRPEKSWSNMAERVFSGEYDLAVTGFSQTLQRHKIADFSIGLTTTSTRLIYLKSSTSYKWMAYLYPMRLDAWLGTLVYYVGAVFIILSMEIVVVFGIENNWPTPLDRLSANFAFIYPLFAMVGRRYPTEPVTLSIRIAFLSMSFGGFVLIR